MLINSLRGFAMSIADSLPGISGGTIAYILGFYDIFIDNLNNLTDRKKRKSALKFVAQLLLGWVIGFSICVLILASLFDKYIYTMSSLLIGLTLFSIPIIVKSEKKIFKKDKKSVIENIIFFIIGLAVVIFITSFRNKTLVHVNSLNQIDLMMALYLFVSAMIAISAMVLPGISGSSILLIFGLYLPVINAVKEILHFNLNYLLPLICFGLGIVAGIFTTIKLVKKALKSHRSNTISLIIGLVIAAIYAIIMGPTTLDIPKAPLSLDTFNIISFICGGLIIFILNYLQKKKTT